MQVLAGSFLLMLQLWSPLPTLLFVGGFIPSSLPPIDDRRLLFVQSMDPHPHSNDFTIYPPSPPICDIAPSTLIEQAYTELNVNQLRDLLRANGAKVSGNKRELVNRVESILVPMGGSRTGMQKSPTQVQVLRKDRGRDQFDSFSKMTVNELKNLLRLENASVSGNKRELVQRLMNLHGNGSSFDLLNLSAQNDTVAPGAEWSILEPSTIEASKLRTINGEGFVELPLLSGLLFVNKPAGYSTLPTKQQLDNPMSPTYPCLSDEVKVWLRTDPKGQKILQQAIECEEIWWEYIVRELKNDPKQQRKLKREMDGQVAKMSKFDPRPVHRLDIDTSGIVCIALTPYALRASNMLFEKKTRSIDNTEIVQKRYVALVEGQLDCGQGETIVDHPIGKVWVDDHNEWACDISGDGSSPFVRPGDVSTRSFVPESLRHAHTNFRVVHTSDGDKSENSTRVELKPQTGRGHQLRLHMASIGHPIVGDYMHGYETQSDGERLCLHASELSLDTWCVSSEEAPGRKFHISQVCVQSFPSF